MRKTHGARQNIEGLFKRLEQGYETVRQWPKFMIYLSLSLRFYPQPSTNSNLTQSNWLGMRILVKKKWNNNSSVTRINTLSMAQMLSLFFETRILEKFSEKYLP